MKSDLDSIKRFGHVLLSAYVLFIVILTSVLALAEAFLASIR